MSASVIGVLGRSAVVEVMAGVSEDRARDLFAVIGTDGKVEYKDLTESDKAELDDVVKPAMRTVSAVVGAIGAKAKLDKMYFDALKTAGFTAQEAVTIVAAQGVNFLLGE